jgi:hypothetical protein
MLVTIRRFKLVVIGLAIAGLGAGLGVSASQHGGYTSRSVLKIDRGVQVHSMRKAINDAAFWRNVVGDRPYRMNGYPGWIVLAGTANEVKSRITTQPVSGRVFTITATASTPHQAASLVRAVTTDFALSMRPGSKIWLHVLTYATNPVAVTSISSVIPGSIGVGCGLALGLLLATALSAFPNHRRPLIETA